jgi:hypothetical protein
MKEAVTEVREEIQDLYDAIDVGESEDAAALKAIAKQLLSLLTRSEIEQEARKRTDLARAVMEFAEWHKEGYMDDGETRKIISQSLWDRVSENVRDVLQQTPPIPTSS